MKLSVPERFALLGVLPQQGNFVTLKLVRELREAISFTEEEIDQFKIKHGDDRVVWDNSLAADKEIAIGSTMSALIVDALKKLDAAQQLTDAHLPLYEKFVSSGQA